MSATTREALAFDGHLITMSIHAMARTAWTWGLHAQASAIEVRQENSLKTQQSLRKVDADIELQIIRIGNKFKRRMFQEPDKEDNIAAFLPGLPNWCLEA